MSRRTHRRPRRRATRRSGGSSTWLWSLLIAVPVATLLGLAGATAYVSNNEPDLDETTLCEEAPAGLSLVLVDISDPVSPGQRQRLAQEIVTFVGGAQTGSLVAIGRLDADATDDPLTFSLCRPRHVAEASSLYQNPRLIAEEFATKFGEPLEAQIDSLLMAFPESLGKDTAIKTFAESSASVASTFSETVLGLSEAVTFAPGGSDLTPNISKTLRALGRRLSDLKATIRVEGHADASGDAATNETLSLNRATAVAKALAAGGLPQASITSEGFGDSAPIASNDTAEGRARNRRVEIIIASASPIMEGIQAAVSSLPDQSSFAEGSHLRLLIVSDLLQNSPAMSFYQGGSWRSFEESAAFDRLSRNLDGYDVEILRFPRPDARGIDPDQVEDFWARYFDRQNVARIASVRVLGDL